MRCRVSVVAAGCLLLILTASGAAAQAPNTVTAPYDALDAAAVTVRVLGPNNEPLNQQAFVSLYKFGSGTPLSTQITKNTSEVIFGNLPGYGQYTIAVDSAGFATTRKDFEYTQVFTRFTVDIVMRAPSSADSVAGPTSTLSPKAQKHVQKGLDAMQAGKPGDAQKEFIEAYNADSKNAYVCYLLGAAYQKGKDLQSAQRYLEMATSLDPKNVDALVALGQLRHQQKDDQAAVAPLEKAVSLDPNQWQARWVLADIYLRSGEYEKAQKNAHAAVELGKGAAKKAELIEGQALAQLGRRDDAVAVLEAFLHDLPGDPAAPNVRAYIAKLKSSTPDTPGTPAAK